MRRGGGRERWLPLVFLALAFAVVAPAFLHPDHFAGSYDWRLFQTWLEAGRRSVLWYHQVPLWNPWTCGGQVYLANPQSLVASPTFLLILAFGTALGEKLMLVAYYFCAFDGMYRLARAWDLAPVDSFLAAVLFGTSGWLAIHFAEGHCTFLGAALFPYLMLCYRRSLAPAGIEPGSIQWEWTLPLGALAAWIVALGGTSTPPMAMVLLATLATMEAIARRSLRPYLPLLVAAVAALAIGAVRMLPALEFALDHPRHLFETDANNPLEMVRNGYWWNGIEPINSPANPILHAIFPSKRYWFHEYGWRLPYVTIPLALWAIRVKAARRWWVLVGLGAAIVAGRGWPYGPWWLLHQLPIFRDLRVPSRYQILFALAFPLLCAHALADLRARWAAGRGRPIGRRVAAVVIALALVDGLGYDGWLFARAFDLHWRLAPRGTPFYQVVGDWRSMMANVFENHGAIGCDEEAPLQRAERLDEGPGPQARVEDGAGQVQAVRWSPNRVEVDVALAGPAVVSVNQNWNEHWRAAADGAAVEVIRVGPKLARDHDGGRLGARVPPGSHTVAFVYRPRSFVIGAVASALAIPLAAWLWWRTRRRRAAT